MINYSSKKRKLKIDHVLEGTEKEERKKSGNCIAGR
mgnify:CR=1 FL=1